MIGIKEIGTYIPTGRINNKEKMAIFNVDENFIENKIGVLERSRKSENENTSDLCVKALENLEKKLEFKRSEIGALIVVTQNPDYQMPHTSAIIHSKTGLQETCACFDISLGCSGFVYGLSVIESFMMSNSIGKGLLITSDPYSKVIDDADKNTSMIFGDAATATLIDENPKFVSGKFSFGTIGTEYECLIVKNGKLSMNGRGIFNFAASRIPRGLKKVLKENSCSIEDIDKFLFHPGSKYIVDMLTRRCHIPEDKVPFLIKNYGNTVSSSIPLMLEAEIGSDAKTLFISGFGVGLSWANTILKRG